MSEEKKDYKRQVEALLFASGRFMDVNTLLNLTGASNKKVLINNIEKLKKEYDGRNSPLMIVKEKDGWKLTVRETYLPLVRKIVSETELPKTILETLAIIAWKSPVLQSDVVKIRHNKAYEHISELVELGFIRKEPSGRSYMLNLTEKFYEYFEVAGAKNIRDVFKKVVGRPKQTKVDDFDNMPDWYKQGAAFLDEPDLEKQASAKIDDILNSEQRESEKEVSEKNSDIFNEL